jgi:hypothetical protein
MSLVDFILVGVGVVALCGIAIELELISDTLAEMADRMSPKE